MKNNALKLISLAVLVPMMTACPNSSKRKIVWSQEIDDAMLLYCGEVLPFAELDKETLDYGYDDNYSVFYLEDSSETSVLENYAELLTVAGFEETENQDFYGDTYLTYDKTNEIGAISVEFYFYEGDDEYHQGNYIYVGVPEYVTEDLLAEWGYEKQQGWPEALVGETLEGSGVTIAPVNANGEWWVASELAHSDEYGDWYCAYLATKGDFTEEMDAALTAAGCEYDDYWGGYCDPTETSDYFITVAKVREFTIVNIEGPTLEPEITNETTNPDGSIDVSFTFSGNFTNGQSFESYTFESTSASLTVAKAGASNNPAYYDNGETLRFYAGSTLTISSAEGLKINSVELTIGPSNSKAWTNAANLYSATSGTISATTNNTSIASVNANSLTITLGVGKTSGNIAFSQIVVNVVAAE